MTTIFEKIINKEIPSEIVFENDDVIAIKDINPIAPVHILVISKKVIESFQKIEKQDFPVFNQMIEVCQKIAKEFGVENGYRIITNIGKSSGQTVFHLHLHLIGGKDLNWNA